MVSTLFAHLLPVKLLLKKSEQSDQSICLFLQGVTA